MLIKQISNVNIGIILAEPSIALKMSILLNYLSQSYKDEMLNVPQTYFVN
jgi:hypothetical protein